VSVRAKELNEHVEHFSTRRLEDAGPFTFVAATRSCSRSARAAGTALITVFRETPNRAASAPSAPHQ
jgi:hypothetical protein